MERDGLRDEFIRKIRGSYICALCAFFVSVFSLLTFADMAYYSKNSEGSVDTLVEKDFEYLSYAYMKYMEDPEKTDVFMMLFTRREGSGELR